MPDDPVYGPPAPCECHHRITVHHRKIHYCFNCECPKYRSVEDVTNASS